ncbi:putative serine/threonine protein kinase [Streptomyces hygroscopicus subsp. jinggangensis 5008]|nr:putative serine/threonine protein kinase [Streptomyces hygroscopicus subsp. jinggangensis 5008]AGF59702.1 putative serine/threonine protein kinase [Streptomyces hygroscopicus subsp. jinggangensis TL01]
MQAGTVLDGRYRLIEPIGAGGFGQVWKAHDPRVDRLVAVKVLKEQPAPLRTLRPDAPEELERLVTWLLAKDPTQRPDSAGEVYDLLEEINDRHFGDTPAPSRGADITSEVWLSPSEATDGAVIPMRLTARVTCPDCATTGDETKVLDCPTCRGEGRVVSKRHTYKVRVPAGVKNGQKIRLRELGVPGKNGGAPGDLYVTVHVT